MLDKFFRARDAKMVVFLLAFSISFITSCSNSSERPDAKTLLKKEYPSFVSSDDNGDELPKGGKAALDETYQLFQASGYTITSVAKGKKLGFKTDSPDEVWCVVTNKKIGSGGSTHFIVERESLFWDASPCEKEAFLKRGCNNW